MIGVVGVVAVVTAFVALVGTRSWRTSLLVLVELLTAAGLLHLAADPSWSRIVTAAAIVTVRVVVVASVRPVARA